MIVFFTDPALHATFHCAPIPSIGIRAVVLHAIKGLNPCCHMQKSIDALGLDVHVGSGAAERVCGGERTREGCNHGFQ